MEGVDLHCHFSLSRDQDVGVEGFVSDLLQLAKKKKKKRYSCRMRSVARKQLRNLPCLQNFEGLDNKLTEQREE